MRVLWTGSKVGRLNFLLTNDDGYGAPGLIAALNALKELGNVFIVAPKSECSACSHRISLRRNIGVERGQVDGCAEAFIVDGWPADCVRLGISELVKVPIDTVVSGINNGANSGIDVFYSGTVAGAREAAILGLPGIAVSQALRGELKPDWAAASRITQQLLRQLIESPIPGPGFWNINLPSPIPSDAMNRICHVALEPLPPPMCFERKVLEEGKSLEFRDTASYWTRATDKQSDYSVIRDGGIAVTAVPLFGRF